jgi:FkbM family methyltransferase
MLHEIKFYWSAAGVLGVLGAITGKVTHRPVLMKETSPDLGFPVYLRLPSSDLSAFKQVVVERLYDFVTATEPRTIVDAGANIGCAAIYFASRYPESRIIAIEPESSNFAMLRKNVAPYPNVMPIQAALWDADEEIDLVDPGFGKWGFMTESNPRQESRNKFHQRVRAITVNSIMSEFKLSQIDILKVDIEGAEREVFRSAASWIGKVDAIVIELHEHLKAGCESSFYDATKGFDEPWRQGENIVVTRNKCLKKRAAAIS